MSTPTPPHPTPRPPRPAALTYANSRGVAVVFKSLNHGRRYAASPNVALHSASLRACFINAVQKKHAAVCVESGVRWRGGNALCAADLKWGEAETMAMKKTCPASRAGVERDSIYFPRLRGPQNGAQLQSGCGGERDVKQESTAANPSVVAEAVERHESCFFYFIFLYGCCGSNWVAVGRTIAGPSEVGRPFQGGHSQSAIRPSDTTYLHFLLRDIHYFPLPP